MVSTVEGRDAYCSLATDQATCETRSDVCQPSFEDSADESLPPVFSACISNPIVQPTPTPGDGTTTPAPGDGTTTPAPGDGTTSPTPPTIEDAYNAKCDNVNADDLWIKKTMKKDQVVSRVVKVKVCHQTGNLSMHTILIACPALRPHIEHHEDYIGACH
jgi:hypothetical protein